MTGDAATGREGQTITGVRAECALDRMGSGYDA